MRRTATVALLVGGLVALPLPSASACSVPAPVLETSAVRVPQGGTLRVAGDEVEGAPPCMTPTMPVQTPSETPTATPFTETVAPSEEPSAEPSEEPSGEPAEPAAPSGEPATPVPSSPAPVPVAAAAAAPAAVVAAPRKPLTTVVVLGRPSTEPYDSHGLADSPLIELARADVTARERADGGTRYRFATTVRIPRDLPPGTYRLHAGIDRVVNFGTADLTVLESLPDTGGDVAPLARLAALLLLAGVGALALEQARTSRVRA